LVDMNKVFEQFVAHRLRRALRGVLDVQGQHQTHLDVGNDVPIRPDLVFRGGRVPFYVGDTKYKVVTDGFALGSDYYQLLSYCSALGLTEGVLVYGQHEGGVPPQSVTVRNTGQVLHTRSLRLVGTPAELDADVDALASWISRRTASHQRQRLAS
jgi:5-methylcytosine-specific restriction enzyme subunit McrC